MRPECIDVTPFAVLAPSATERDRAVTHLHRHCRYGRRRLRGCGGRHRHGCDDQSCTGGSAAIALARDSANPHELPPKRGFGGGGISMGDARASPVRTKSLATFGASVDVDQSSLWHDRAACQGGLGVAGLCPSCSSDRSSHRDQSAPTRRRRRAFRDHSRMCAAPRDVAVRQRPSASIAAPLGGYSTPATSPRAGRDAHRHQPRLLPPLRDVGRQGRKRQRAVLADRQPRRSPDDRCRASAPSHRASTTFHCTSTAHAGTLTISGSGGGVQPTPQSFDQPLVIPKVLTTANIRIPMKQVGVRVMPTGPLTTMWTYGGTYPGPTIGGPPAKTPRSPSSTTCRRRPVISVHFHGDHHAWTVRRAADEVPRHARQVAHLRLSAHATVGSRSVPPFHWYHDHRMWHDDAQQLAGLAGDVHRH